MRYKACYRRVVQGSQRGGREKNLGRRKEAFPEEVRPKTSHCRHSRHLGVGPWGLTSQPTHTCPVVRIVGKKHCYKEEVSSQSQVFSQKHDDVLTRRGLLSRWWSVALPLPLTPVSVFIPNLPFFWPDNQILVAEFSPLGSCSSHATTVILLAPWGKTALLCVRPSQGCAMSQCLFFSQGFACPARVPHTCHSFASTGHRVIPASCVSNGLALPPHPRPRGYLLQVSSHSTPHVFVPAFRSR